MDEAKYRLLVIYDDGTMIMYDFFHLDAAMNTLNKPDRRWNVTREVILFEQRDLVSWTVLERRTR